MPLCLIWTGTGSWEGRGGSVSGLWNCVLHARTSWGNSGSAHSPGQRPLTLLLDLEIEGCAYCHTVTYLKGAHKSTQRPLPDNILLKRKPSLLKLASYKIISLGPLWFALWQYSQPYVFLSFVSMDSTNHRSKILKKNSSLLNVHGFFSLSFPWWYNEISIYIAFAFCWYCYKGSRDGLKYVGRYAQVICKHNTPFILFKRLEHHRFWYLWGSERGFLEVQGY